MCIRDRGATERLRDRRRATFVEERLAPVVREAAALGITATELTSYLHQNLTDDKDHS